jgi:hypothetical protein
MPSLYASHPTRTKQDNRTCIPKRLAGHSCPPSSVGAASAAVPCGIDTLFGADIPVHLCHRVRSIPPVGRTFLSAAGHSCPAEMAQRAHMQPLSPPTLAPFAFQRLPATIYP